MNESGNESTEKIDRESVREDERALSPEERFKIVLAKRLARKV
jgi:hypothetical protein